MKLNTRLHSLVFVSLIAGTTGCFVDGQATVEGPAPVATVEVDVAPPPPEQEVVVVRPGMVWIGGHHEWVGGRYVWRRGYYERERRGYRWEPGRWERRGRRHVWIGGHWRR